MLCTAIDVAALSVGRHDIAKIPIPLTTSHAKGGDTKTR